MWEKEEVEENSQAKMVKVGMIGVNQKNQKRIKKWNKILNNLKKLLQGQMLGAIKNLKNKLKNN